MKNDRIKDLITEDIERCKTFLNSTENEKQGVDLYIEITGKYDSIIPNFGSGLYQYIEELHFYDAEISGETLVHNLRKLLAKMTTYRATIVPIENEEKKPTQRVIGNKVFIVHGHDEAAIQETARTLEKGGFKAIILHEQADSGMTIIEKIEHYTDVDFAVVLYTECDLGRVKECDVDQEKYRARQNVVFEHGYLISRLGRKNVCALVKGNVETPGDINGVIYVSMDPAGAWKLQLAKNMKASGLKVNMNNYV